MALQTRSEHRPAPGARRGRAGWAALGLALVLAGAGAGAASAAEPAKPAGLSKPATSLSADERLDAIRDGLMRAALEGATRVESVAWLDTDGRLHESSSFRSGMQVRGVQVLAYARDAEGQPRARLNMPANESPLARRDLYKDALTAPAAPTCSAGDLRHLIGLELAVAGTWSAHDAPLGHALAQRVSAVWLRAEGPGVSQSVSGLPNWRMLPEGDGAVKTADDLPPSAYERVLLRADSLALPWVLSVQVQPGPPPAAAQGLAFLQSLLGEAAPATARISMTLSKRLSLKPGQGQGPSQAVLSLSADVPLLREPGQWGAPQFSPAGRARVEALLARWRQTIDAQLACEPVQPEVMPTANGLLRLNAGALAGVQPGEEWLLADPAVFPERVLAPGALSQLVLARVQKLHAGHAELQIVAGVARPVQAGWRAWRAESPLSD